MLSHCCQKAKDDLRFLIFSFRKDFLIEVESNRKSWLSGSMNYCLDPCRSKILKLLEYGNNYT